MPDDDRKQTEQKIRSLTPYIDSDEFLTAPSQLPIDQLSEVIKQKASEHEAAETKFKHDHNEIKKIMADVNRAPDPTKVNKAEKMMDAVKALKRQVDTLKQEQVSLEQKKEHYKNYLDFNKELSTLAGEEPAKAFRQGLMDERLEARAKREAMQKRWQEIENLRHEAMLSSGRYREATWKLKSDRTTPESPSETDCALESAGKASRFLQSGTYHVTCYGNSAIKRRYEGDIIVGEDQSMHLVNVPQDRNERMALYRTMIHHQGVEFGHGRLTLDFPNLTDPKNLNALSVREVLDILQIAKEEGKEIIPGKRLQEWADNLKKVDPTSYEAYQRALAETKTTYEARLQQTNADRADKAISNLLEARNELIQSKEEHYHVNLEAFSQSLNRIEKEIELGMPNAELSKQYAEAVDDTRQQLIDEYRRVEGFNDQELMLEYQLLSARADEVLRLAKQESTPAALRIQTVRNQFLGTIDALKHAGTEGEKNNAVGKIQSSMTTLGRELAKDDVPIESKSGLLAVLMLAHSALDRAPNTQEKTALERQLAQTQEQIKVLGMTPEDKIKHMRESFDQDIKVISNQLTTSSSAADQHTGLSALQGLLSRHDYHLNALEQQLKQVNNPEQTGNAFKEKAILEQQSRTLDSLIQDTLRRFPQSELEAAQKAKFMNEAIIYGQQPKEVVQAVETLRIKMAREGIASEKIPLTSEQERALKLLDMKDQRQSFAERLNKIDVTPQKKQDTTNAETRRPTTPSA